MPAVSTMVIASLVALGEKAIGATLTTDEGTHYLNKFNAFMDSCSQERANCYTIQQDSFALTANISTYSVGASSSVVTSRPNRVVDAYVRDSSNADHPIVVLGQSEFAALANKTATATWPSAVYYNADFTATSTATLHFWPVPTSALTVYLGSWKQLGTAAHLSTNVLLPPGYQRFIETNFAIESAPGLREPSQALVKIARESKAAIKGINLPDSIMRLDAGVRGRSRSNIYDGP